MSRRWLLIAAFGVSLVATVVPLWSAHYLPFVDIPQHLYLINVLGHLNDPATLYPDVFKARGEITPYLGYYETVRLFALVMDVFHANALFLTLAAIAAPLSVGLLSRRLGGSFWIGILACPLFYGDNLYWGFINYCAALPLVLFAIVLFLGVLEDRPGPRFGREVGLALLLVAVQLTHVQAFVYAAVVLPLLLLMTPSDRARRIRAVAAAGPAVALFAVWSLGRLGEQPDIAPGEPWKAWGPILSSANLSFYPWNQNLNQLTSLLTDGFRDNSDRQVIPMLGAIGLAALVLGVVASGRRKRPFIAVLRGPMLAVVALAMFLFMPFDVRGYMYYVNYRFAELFALVLIASLPFPSNPWAGRGLAVAGMLVCVWYGSVLTAHFVRFQHEAEALDPIIAATGERPRIMALSFDTGSAVVTHPVYLHSASYAALAHGGMTSFSFASTAHSPLAYRGKPPPAPRSEWRASDFDYAAYGKFYDHYLVRGRVSAAAVFRGRQAEVKEAARSGPFALYERAPEMSAGPETP